jgi:hypothetical protein
MASTVPDLPLWGWNLIIAMQRHEELHGSQDTCLKGVLNAVPADVRQHAEAISDYVQKASGHKVADNAIKTYGELIGSFFDKTSEPPAPETETTP